VYPASEGFIAVADRGFGEGLRVNIDNGIFYEFVPVEEPVEAPQPPKAKRTNIWGRIISHIRDPLIVVVLMFVLSLPGFHTVVSKLVPWAFAVGGELSYLGLILKSLFAGALFAVLQFGSSFL
jgi:hypothetical protein